MLRYAFGLQALSEAFHWPTLVLIGIAAACASVDSPWGILDFSATKLIELVFPLAGVIIALALPAAQLSLEIIRQAQQLSAKILGAPDLSEQGVELVSSVVKGTRDKLLPAWRAVVYALASFLLAVMGALGLFSKDSALLPNLIATASLGFLVASAIWFYPTVRYGFRLEVFDDTIEAARLLAPQLQQGTSAGSRVSSAPSPSGGSKEVSAR